MISASHMFFYGVTFYAKRNILPNLFYKSQYFNFIFLVICKDAFCH